MAFRVGIGRVRISTDIVADEPEIIPVNVLVTEGDLGEIAITTETGEAIIIIEGI
ncbi:MAG TPA: hypothetical protein VMV77_08915 [Bacteroidales bacterium]|nr:hypothetical protein [Bacteroidales bacterium]